MQGSSADNLSRKEMALFDCDSEENKNVTVPCDFLGFFCLFFFCADDVLLLLQSYNNPKWWSHSNVFRIHSRDWTPATSVSGKRPEDQIRCCWWQALPSNIKGSEKCCWVTVAQWRMMCPLNTSDWSCVFLGHQQMWRKSWLSKSQWKEYYLFSCRPFSSAVVLDFESSDIELMSQKCVTIHPSACCVTV